MLIYFIDLYNFAFILLEDRMIDDSYSIADLHNIT